MRLISMGNKYQSKRDISKQTLLSNASIILWPSSQTIKTVANANDASDIVTISAENAKWFDYKTKI